MTQTQPSNFLVYKQRDVYAQQYDRYTNEPIATIEQAIAIGEKCGGIFLVCPNDKNAAQYPLGREIYNSYTRVRTSTR